MPLRRTKLLIIDVDGTMTDGKIYIDADGRELKAFSVHDGSALMLLRETGMKVALLSSRSSKALDNRAKELGIDDVFQGVADKIEVLTALLDKYNFRLDEVAYVGDDFSDLPVMRQVGFSFAVANAREVVKEFAHYVTGSNGGEGAVSEVVVKILKAQNVFEKVVNRFLK